MRALKLILVIGQRPGEVVGMPFIGGLHMASPSRLLLENLSHIKAREGATKVAGQKMPTLFSVPGEL